MHLPKTHDLFIYLKAAFSSFYSVILLLYFSLKDVSQKFIPPFQYICEQRNRIPVYSDLSLEFIIRIGVRQGHQLSLFLFDFIIEMITGIPLSCKKLH